jgi:RNA methyltransferase, TrmH family
MRNPPSSREQRELNALRERKNREAAGRFLAEGVRVVEDLEASGLTIRWVLGSSSLEDGSRAAQLLERLQGRGTPVREVEAREFARLADTEQPQGVLAVADIPARTLDDLPGAGTLLVLDAVQDPGNFGTLIRSAEALGAAGVVALPGTVDPWNAKAVRSAAGSSFRLPLVQVGWEAARGWLHGHGYQILAAAAGGQPVAPSERVALVVGNEGAGVSEAVRSGSDAIVGIPLRGRAESLNVAAAAAILLYELTR